MPMTIITDAARAYNLAIEVGDFIYVWSRGGRMPARNTRDCVISSHGGLSTTGTPRPVGTEVLHYYCPHGNAMTTSAGTIAQIAAREIRYYEAVRLQDNVHDYDLSKFQGAHVGPKNMTVETYADIQNGMTQEARQRTIRDLINRRFIGATEAQYNAVRETDMDVITIRNRRQWYYGRPPSLYGVIAQLHAAGYFYRHVHCAFCRVYEGSETGWLTSNNRNAAPDSAVAA